MLLQKLKDYRLILASSSPRRQQFLRDMNLDFEVRSTNVEEVFPKQLKGTEITDYLAELKANVFDLKEKEILVSCDTIVCLGDRVFGKPRDYNEAYSFLKELSGKTHQVISSVCIKSYKRKKIFSDVTLVTFAKLFDEMIGFYLDNYKPFDKAGAYGIQDWLGAVAIEKIEGSYTNVVGLPTEKFYRELLCFIQ